VDPKNIPAAIQSGASPTKVMMGTVGVGVTNALAPLHVRASVGIHDATHAPGITMNHVVLLENKNTGTNINGMAIRLQKAATDASNFISFIVSTNVSSQPYSEQKTIIGGIEQGPQQGVQYTATSADYAEFMLKKYSNDLLKPGEIIGVYHGYISKETKGADQLMVMSTAPIIVGNMPKRQDQNLYGKVAFMGQVPVYVRGSVKAGDYIVPSGLEDGIGIAVSEDVLRTDQLDQIVGRAWEESQSDEIKMVKVAVGFSYGNQILARRLSVANELRKTIEILSSKNAEMEKIYAEKLQERQLKINQIIERIHP
jgi:hypothetical protein